MDKQFPKRTDLQNKSLHLYCQQVSDTLNEAGIGYKTLITGLEIEQSMETIKSVIRLIGGAKYRKYSTAELTTKELMDCYEEFNKHLATLGVHVPFPSQEELNFKETYEKNKRY
jgi:hypothetical protein